MDDDFTFGASVWGAPESAAASSKPIETTKHLTSAGPGMAAAAAAGDEFDDFGSPPQVTVDVSADDDDFGDFGDFDEAKTVPSAQGFGDDMAFEEPVAGPSSYGDWDALHLAPLPGTSKLEADINHILAPVWGSQALSELTTDDAIREMEGINQILVTPESRDLYKMLIQSPPPTKPPNWIRSRIRRQHLIALGIPVNLDEVLPQASVRALPPLNITTRPMSAPPGARGPNHSGYTSASTNNSRAASPRNSPAPFGPNPDLDDSKIQSLLAVDAESLSLLPLTALERHLIELRAHTAKTSTRLTHLLQTRDALQQDSETYNGLIAELVGEAQKIKTVKGRNPIRRGSGMV